MIRQNLKPAFDQDKLKKLSGKEYRDAYLRDQVHNWIAYQFQSLRKKLKLTQNEMSKLTNKPQSVISRLESESYKGVSVQSLLDFACAMDVALVVQFVSYPDFLGRLRDKSETAMQPETISESLAKQERKRFEYDTRPSCAKYQISVTAKHDSAFAANARNAKETEWIQTRCLSRESRKLLIGMHK